MSLRNRVKPHSWLLFTIALIMTTAHVSAAPKSELWEFWNTWSPSNLSTIDHSAWQEFLDQFVVVRTDGLNLVRYASVDQVQKDKLNDYVAGLLQIDPRELNKREQFAYWVNLYNAATVQLIVQNYPISSITKLGQGWFTFGPWDDPIGNIAGQTITLNDIEHRILRPIWNEPRIHFVVNCASLGCPNLPTRALTSENTQTVLASATNAFINHPRAIKVADDRLVLSSIFDWYQSDFGNTETDVLNFIKPYVSNQSILERLEAGKKLRIRYDYDWELNAASENK